MGHDARRLAPMGYVPRAHPVRDRSRVDGSGEPDSGHARCAAEPRGRRRRCSPNSSTHGYCHRQRDDHRCLLCGQFRWRGSRSLVPRLRLQPRGCGRLCGMCGTGCSPVLARLANSQLRNKNGTFRTYERSRCCYRKGRLETQPSLDLPIASPLPNLTSRAAASWDVRPKISIKPLALDWL